MKVKKSLVPLITAMVAAMLCSCAMDSAVCGAEYFEWEVVTEGTEVWSLSYGITEISTFLHTEGETTSGQFQPVTTETFYLELYVGSNGTDATSWLEYYDGGWKTKTSLSAYTDDSIPEANIAPRMLTFGKRIQPLQRPPTEPAPVTKTTSVSLSSAYSYRIRLSGTRRGEGTSVNITSRVYRKWDYCYLSGYDSGSAYCSSAAWNNVDTYNAPLTPLHGGSVRDIKATLYYTNHDNVNARLSNPQATSGNIQARVKYKISISNVYPNAASRGTNRKVQYTLNADGYVKAEVFNSLGQLVHTENYGWVTACTNREVVFWNGSEVSAGVYTVKFKVWNEGSESQYAYSNTKSFTVL
jgi:hypothetical protein